MIDQIRSEGCIRIGYVDDVCDMLLQRLEIEDELTRLRAQLSDKHHDALRENAAAAVTTTAYGLTIRVIDSRDNANLSEALRLAREAGALACEAEAAEAERFPGTDNGSSARAARDCAERIRELCPRCGCTGDDETGSDPDSRCPECGQ